MRYLDNLELLQECDKGGLYAINIPSYDNNYYKIGMSVVSLYDRLISYISYYPKKDFKVIYRLEMLNRTKKQRLKIKKAEKLMHIYLYEYITHNEWFKIKDNAIIFRALKLAQRRFGGRLKKMK